MKPLRRHPLLIPVLLAALFVRALVPAGFMPAKGELVELCSMHGPLMVMTDPETGEIIPAEESASQGTCPWSLLLSSLATPAFAPAIVEALAATPLPSTPDLIRSGRPSLVTPPARAPPASRLA